MPKFRKKPIVIEAVQWQLGDEHPGVAVEAHHPAVPIEERRFYVVTAHEQRAYLSPGDWIIPEPRADRYYPCKPDIFAATYDPVE